MASFSKLNDATNWAILVSGLGGWHTVFRPTIITKEAVPGHGEQAHKSASWIVRSLKWLLTASTCQMAGGD